MLTTQKFVWGNKYDRRSEKKKSGKRSKDKGGN